MKILFIFKSENFLVPIGLCAISAMARREGHEVYLSETKLEDPLERVARLKPDIVAFGSSTGESKHYIRLNQKIKQRFPGVFTIMGGPHPTFYPDMIHETTLEAICIGEGEEAFTDVLRALSSGGTVSGIPNIFTRGDKSFTVRHLVEDLDSLPYPDYSLLYDNTEMGKYPLKAFMTSRGCPYNCTYCFNSAWRELYSGRGRVTRKHSVDHVIEDIQKVRERWPLSNVKFQDDIFTYRADDWLEEFSRKYKQHIGLPFFILTRCDLLNEDIVKLLKYAGCHTISMSIEAGNPQIRREMLKRRMSDEQIITAHRLCEKYGISTFTNCILGLPQTTIAQDVESLDLCIKSRVNWAEFPIFYPFPKTQLGNQVINLGLYTPDYNKMHTSYQNASLLSCFSEKEKKVQMNMGLLASVAVVFPWLRNLIVNHLIYWPPNKLFTLFYWLAKNYVLRHRIYVTKTTRWESFRMYMQSLRQELFRHTFEEKMPEKNKPGSPVTK